MVTILWTCSSGDTVGRREKAQFRATHPPGKKHQQAHRGHRGLRPAVTGEPGRTHAARPQGTAHRRAHTQTVCAPCPRPLLAGPHSPSGPGPGAPQASDNGSDNRQPSTSSRPLRGPRGFLCPPGREPSKRASVAPSPKLPPLHTADQGGQDVHTHTPLIRHTRTHMQARRCTQGVYARARGTG